MAFTLADLVGHALVLPRRCPVPVERRERPRCPMHGKAMFATKAEALAVARLVNRGEQHCNKAYRCDVCGAVHLGRRGRRG